MRICIKWVRVSSKQYGTALYIHQKENITTCVSSSVVISRHDKIREIKNCNWITCILSMQLHQTIIRFYGFLRFNGVTAFYGFLRTYIDLRRSAGVLLMIALNKSFFNDIEMFYLHSSISHKYHLSCSVYPGCSASFVRQTVTCLRLY
jgi:hypothetical protein